MREDEDEDEDEDEGEVLVGLLSGGELSIEEQEGTYNTFDSFEGIANTSVSTTNLRTPAYPEGWGPAEGVIDPLSTTVDGVMVFGGPDGPVTVSVSTELGTYAPVDQIDWSPAYPVMYDASPYWYFGYGHYLGTRRPQ